MNITETRDSNGSIYHVVDWDGHRYERYYPDMWFYVEKCGGRTKVMFPENLESDYQKFKK